MTKKIYVGNMAFETTEADIRELFGKLGSVESCEFIKDRETGRFKGFGFVEMSASEADKVIAEFNGKEVGGRVLTVNEARPRR